MCIVIAFLDEEWKYYDKPNEGSGFNKSRFNAEHPPQNILLSDAGESLISLL